MYLLYMTMVNRPGVTEERSLPALALSSDDGVLCPRHFWSMVMIKHIFRDLHAVSDNLYTYMCMIEKIERVPSFSLPSHRLASTDMQFEVY